MELHQLKYFVTVADLGNFTRAAEVCFVSQPSLSQQIIKLEKELGHPLFDRLGRKVCLTDAGKNLYEHAITILNEVDDAKRSITETDAEVGQVKVGVIPTIAPYLLPPILKSFVRKYPKSEVVVYENVTENTIRGCLEGNLDVGILSLPIEENQLVVEPLFTEELLLAMASKNPLAKKRRITMEDVNQEPFILLSETHCLGEQMVSFCKKQSCLPVISCQSAQLLTVQELVALDHGISLIPELAANLDKSKLRKYRSLSGVKPTRTIAMIWHQQRSQSPLVRNFIEMLRETTK